MHVPARLAVLTALVAALALTGVASSAHAASTRELPVDNSLYAVTCPYYSDTTAQTPNNQVLVVDEQTAVATGVRYGTDIDGTNCAGSLTLDPVTGTVYALVVDGGGDFSTLVTVDLVTGASTKVADLSSAGAPAEAKSLAIGLDGAAYVFVNDVLYSLDLSDGVMSFLGSSVVDAWGFVSDPVSGLFYAVDYDGELFEVDVTDGAFVSLATLSFATSPYSLTMDTNGVFWLGEDADGTDEYRTILWSFTLADPNGSAEDAGLLTLGGSALYGMAFVVGPAPAALAETGTTPAGPIAFGSTLLAAGAVLAVAARRRRISL
jgi:hypothetical protein